LAEEIKDELEAQLAREQFDRHILTARLFLKQNRHADAQGVVDQLLEEHADNSEVMELQGDVLRVQGKRKDARAAYEKAVELDKTNVTAERKHAELVLFIGEGERAEKQRLSLLENPDGPRGDGKKRSALSAVIYACIFPGLGQLYNREHEKGLALFVAGALGLILLLNGVILAPSRAVARSAGAGAGMTFGEQFGAWGDELRAIPWWGWCLAILGLVAFVGLHMYSIYDATKVARAAEKDADKLGIEAPG